VSMTLILYIIYIYINMYVQVILFASMVCCVVWSGGIYSVSPVFELSYFFFYLLLCRCRCLSVNNLWVCCQ